MIVGGEHGRGGREERAGALRRPETAIGFTLGSLGNSHSLHQMVLLSSLISFIGDGRGSCRQRDEWSALVGSLAARGDRGRKQDEGPALDRGVSGEAGLWARGLLAHAL